MPPVFSRESDKIYVRNDSRRRQPHNSPCELGCPLHNPIQKMENALAGGDPSKALFILRASNPFPGVTGRVCPHPCEERCNRREKDEGVSIRSLERYAADHGFIDLKRLARQKPSGKKIAIIGSGPAGLSAAYYASLLGHEVTVFEASPVAGGVPRQSIPDFRLPKDVVDNEVGLLLALGVRILVNVEVGKDISLRELRDRHDACLIAVGNRKERRLQIPGIEKAFSAVAFLRETNLARTSLSGKKVVILGGGGVAFDCAFTARRMGAESVSLVCLESRDALRVPIAEVLQADDEDIQLCTGYLASGIELDSEGQVEAVTAQKVSSFSFDEKGALHAEFVPDGYLRLAADVVICASGLLADLSLLEEDAAAVRLTPRGWIETSDSMSSLPGLFAAGECAMGPALVSSAIASGRNAAFEMDAWLKNKPAGLPVDAWIDEEGQLILTHPDKIQPQKEVIFSDIVNIDHHEPARRKSTRSLSARDTWLPFEELDKGLSNEDALAEAARCLHCGHCQTCGECVASCPGLILTMGDTSPQVAYPDECWHCGCCRMACPGGCISFKFPLHTFL